MPQPIPPERLPVVTSATGVCIIFVTKTTEDRQQRGTLVYELHAGNWLHSWMLMTNGYLKNLETQVAALSDPDLHVCCMASVASLPDKTRFVERKSPPSSRDDLYMELLFRNNIPGSTSSVMVRRKCLDEVGFFDESLACSEDRDLWIRLSLTCRFAFVDVPLVRTTAWRPGGYTRDRVRVARGYEGFLANRERDMPARFRHLLPRVRRHIYAEVAYLNYKSGMNRAAMRNSVRAICASTAIDEDFRNSFGILVRSFIPLSFRRHLRSLVQRGR